MNICKSLSEFCRWGLGVGNVHVYHTQIGIMIASIVFAALLIAIPKKLIDIEIALYKAFDWELKPVSMEKKVRDMRALGGIVFLVSLALLMFIYYNHF